ncbi:hypothetical protein [Paenibacillus sp. P22]|nr:hypothetical protein [Paenibacillus sp. P22]CDN44178.1 hypothetical protein BN871_EI_00070 [Paenibacillus sp. P22]
MSDRIGWSLVGAAGVLSVYAGYLFSSRVSRKLAHEVLEWFL